jgi:DNA-binding NtrC family response regulator
VTVAHALIVDDSPVTLESLTDLVRGEGFSVAAALTMDEARTEIGTQPPDIVLVDLNLPDGSGLSLLDSLEDRAGTAVVLITGQASVDTAIEALRRGFTDYLTKPLDVDRLLRILRDVSRTRRLPEELSEMVALQQRTGRFAGLVGRSEALVRASQLIRRVAPSSASVLVTGESGTGKERVARALHDLSRRRNGPYVAVNCGAITPSLMESELFGHERGSFTGAERRHKGYFEQATHGTLFLDEISEMPIELQVKLLRVLETDGMTRVGGEQSIPVDARIVAASNRDPQQAIRSGKLRADLYYRLKVFQIEMAPLRARPEDVPLLAQAFLEEFVTSQGQPKQFGDGVLETLSAYDWPGNVRELRNVVHFAYVLADRVIEVDSLPAEVRRRQERPAAEPAEGDGPAGESADRITVRVGSTIADVERRLITETLRVQGGDKSKSAAVLGISLKTLYNRLSQYQKEASSEDAGAAAGAEAPAAPPAGGRVHVTS